MNNPQDREQEILEATLQLPPEQRAAYLRKACGDDAELRERLLARLRAEDTPLASIEETTVTARNKTIAVALLPEEKSGQRIGRYKLLQEIGEGGCGVVYMAEQQEPVKRRVALKLIKPGMDTRQVLARFEAERQALALMDHQNIAKVLDAGATDTGRPFFVMELVRGIKITEYCDDPQHHLSTGQRLDLFIQICRAVQHAHQKGIIHRDIKPSNILVTLQEDGTPTPKIIDFGIAKATAGQTLTDKTLFTAFEQFIGTPAYMSPEQAAMVALDIDTRSDIYSLGVLLYELLTGRTPFDSKRLIEAGLDEIRRIIREEEPPRPSTRLSTLNAEEQTTVAKRRQSDPPRLIHLVRGDLDWIVMKCLEKDRTRRYETANGLARDIERHLNNQPIVARPPSNLYRLQKLVQRNKAAFAAATSISLLLVAATAVSTWLAFRAKRAERRVVAQLGIDGRIFKRQAIQITDLGRDEAMWRDILAEERKLWGDDPQFLEFLEGAVRNLADALQRQGKFSEVEQLFGGFLTPTTERQSRYFVLVRWRAYFRARHGLWKDAAADYSRAIRGDPSDHRSWWSLAPLLVQTGDLEGYRKHCHDMLARFPITSTNEFPERTAKACLLMPDPGLLSAAAQLAKVAPRPGFEPYALFTQALAEYRHGQYAQAASLAQEVLAAGSDQERLLGTRCYFLAAMALCRSGRQEEARTAWVKGVEIMLNQLPPLGGGDLGDGWTDILVAHILMREATDLFVTGGRAGQQSGWIAKQIYGLHYGLAEPYGLAEQLRTKRGLQSAEQMLAEFPTPDKTSRPEYAELLLWRGYFRGRHGPAGEAASDLALAVQTNPDEHQSWYWLAPLLLDKGDPRGYRELRHQMLARFGVTETDFVAERIAKACLLTPIDGKDSLATAHLAEIAVTRGKDSEYFPSFAFAKALAEFRAGAFESAAEWAQRVLAKAGIDLRRDAQSYLVLAMAHQQLKQSLEARAALAGGVEIVQKKLPGLDSGDLGVNWQDVLIAHILMREAKGLIEGSEKAANETK